MSTHKLLRDFLVCVPESQEAEYAKTVGADRVMTHSNELIGKVAKLNHCLDTVDADALVFLDDDILAMARCWRSASSTSDAMVTDPDFVHDVIVKTADMASQIKASLFGWSSSARHAVYYTGLRPFRLKGFVNGAAMGFIRGHNLRFDIRVAGKEDYDMSLQNAFKHRYCFVDQRFAFQFQPSFVSPGARMRTTQREREVIALLQKKWGESIYVMSKSAGSDARLNRKARAGVDTLAIRVPW